MFLVDLLRFSSKEYDFLTFSLSWESSFYQITKALVDVDRKQVFIVNIFSEFVDFVGQHKGTGLEHLLVLKRF